MRSAPRTTIRAVAATLALCLVIPASASAGGNSTRSSSSAKTASVQTAAAPASGAGSALAALVQTLTTATCPAAAAAVFAPWADPALYALIPGGSFEGLPTWSLFASAPVVGNEPWHINSATDTLSLAILPGGSATSPTFCASLSTPTLRFLARGDSVDAQLKVEVLYADPTSGAVTATTIATVSGTGAWAPTDRILVLANLLSVFSADGLTELSVRLTATSGSWLVDDVHIDPFKKG